MSLNDFLEKKPLYYSEIDYTRMPRAYASIQEKLSIPKIIHIVGTNGKGTTGRFIANALFALGKSTGHYTSPHIQDFNERIWLNGKMRMSNSWNLHMKDCRDFSAMHLKTH
jgi:dihydrofolate synthase / folylpolyglutamate synthase